MTRAGPPGIGATRVGDVSVGRRAPRAGTLAPVLRGSLAPTAAVIGVAVVVGVVSVAVGGVASVAAGLGCLFLALLVRLQARSWPAVILLVTVAVPPWAIPVPGLAGQNGSLSLAILLVPVWLLKEHAEGRLLSSWTRARVLVGVAALSMTAVLTLSTVKGGVEPGSVAWLVNFVLFTVVFALVLREDSARSAVGSLVVSSGVLGAYAVLEAWVLRDNPVWGWIGGSDGVRAVASFGHALPAANFFALVLVLIVGELVGRPRARTVVCGLGCAAGLVAVGSRGPVVAAMAGVALLVVTNLVGSRREPRRLVSLSSAVLMVTAVAVGGFAQRQTAGDVEGSNVVRERSLATGLHLAEQTGLLGFGPGRAYEIKVGTPGPGTDEGRSIENAWLELYVAVGPIGSASVAVFLVLCLATGIARRAWTGVAGTLTLVIAYSAFNALEGAKPLTMMLLGLTLGLCIRTGAPAAGPAPGPAAGGLAAWT